MMKQKAQPQLTKKLTFRVSEEDYQRFQEVVKNYKVKQAEFLRQLTLLGLDKAENSLRLKLLKELIKEVHRIGVNLNQIARWVNTYKDKADAKVVLDRLSEIDKDLKALLKEIEDDYKVVKTR